MLRTLMLFILLNYAMCADQGVVLVEGIQGFDAAIVGGVAEGGHLVINGGYFDLNRKPVGYFKRDGEVIQKEFSAKQSGVVVIGKNKRLNIFHKDKVPSDAVSVFQSGPFLIDPGSKMGIHKQSKHKFDRMVLLKDKRGGISLLYHPRISLYDLALHIQKTYPDTDMALNLDGGPSCCLKGLGHSIVPAKKLPYYIRFTAKP